MAGPSESQSGWRAEPPRRADSKDTAAVVKSPGTITRFDAVKASRKGASADRCGSRLLPHSLELGPEGVEVPSDVLGGGDGEAEDPGDALRRRRRPSIGPPRPPPGGRRPAGPGRTRTRPRAAAPPRAISTRNGRGRRRAGRRRRPEPAGISSRPTLRERTGGSRPPSGGRPWGRAPSRRDGLPGGVLDGDRGPSP